MRIPIRTHLSHHISLSPDFAENLETMSCSTNKAAEHTLAIPGVVVSGWSISDLIPMTHATKYSDQKKYSLKSELMSLVNKVSGQQFA